MSPGAAHRPRAGLPAVVRLRTDERGAYAILFALLVTVLVAILAIVIDIGLLRTDRRIDKSATDFAAIAGVTRLGQSLQPDPHAACLLAIAYLRQNLAGASGDLTALCGSFPTPSQSGYSSCPSTAISATGTLTGNGGSYTVGVTWPVYDTSPLMAPDIRPSSSALTQAIVADDGTPFSRFGVSVSHTRASLFAGIFGQTSGGTSNHSVARVRIGAGSGGLAAPLVVLDPHACDALTAEGGGGVQIKPNSAGVPGLIAVNSDGTGGDCNGGATTMSSNALNGYNSSIWAWDYSPTSRAAIFSYAVTLGHADAYNPAQVTCTSSNPPSGPLCPRPSALYGQIPRQAFIDNQYNCFAVGVGTCATASDPKNGIGQLRAYAEAAAATLAGGGIPAGISTIVSGSECTSPQPSYSGAVYVDCAASNGGFTVGSKSSVVFNGGPVIFAGDVKVKAGGCLAFNVAPDSVSTECTTPTLTAQSQDGPVVFIAGQINVSSTDSSFIAPQTFVMEGDCSFDGTTCTTTPANLGLQTSGTGSILWSAPLGPNLSSPVTCVPALDSTQAPSSACFAKLALWNEYASTSSTPDTVSGQAALLLQGTFFTPNAQFVLSGGSLTNIQNAQFVTGRLDVHGGGMLTMIPNDTLTNPPPLISAGLIR